MQDEATAVGISRPGISASVETRPHVRLLHGMRRPANWLQLVRFGIVGGSRVRRQPRRLRAVCASAGDRLPRRVGCRVAGGGAQQLRAQPSLDVRRAARAARASRRSASLLVSLVAEGFSLLLLTVFVESAGIAKVAAQALAVAASMPLNFLGNKLWSFRASA